MISRAIEARHPYIDPLNLLQVESLGGCVAGVCWGVDCVIVIVVLQVFVLKELRAATAAGSSVDATTADTLMVTIQGIAAGMQNTG